MSKKKQEVVANISKDKNRIDGLWKNVQLNNKLSRENTGYVSIEFFDIQRRCAYKILDLSMADYHSHDPNDDDRNTVIAYTFSEFWDFLHWWLKDVGIDGHEWNEMDHYRHEIRKKYPKEHETLLTPDGRYKD